MGWAAVALLGLQLFREGILTYVEIKAIWQKYEGLEPTPENIEQARLDFVKQAKFQSALDDPTIRAKLIEYGYDPDSLRIPDVP